MDPNPVAAIPCPLLHELFETWVVRDGDGNLHRLHSDIGAEYAVALYRAVLKREPATVLEVGMAYGVSSLAILTALDQLGGDRRLLSIDPHQDSGWRKIGMLNVQRAGLAGRHTLLETFDYLALPRLLEQGSAVDFAYVDGWHTFDYVLVDFFYLDKLLKPGGVIGFNDCNWPAVQKALRFVEAHRRYRQLDAGLLPGQDHDRYFEKLESWEPDWDFFTDF